MTEPMQAVVASTLDGIRSRGPVGSTPRELIQKMLSMQIKVQETVFGTEFSSEEVTRMQAELESRLRVTIGGALDLVDTTGHEEWYLGGKRTPGPFLARYVRWLSEKGWAEEPLQSLKETTSRVLELIENPERSGPWDRRGLVMGNVQSGKTAHYAGVICRAADAGYRIIIVLAGMHNLLRSQTQKRLDADFLGFDTGTTAADGGRKPIGVGLKDPNPRADFVTTSAINGDFTAGQAAKLGFTPDRTPWLFVLKKNASVLAALNSWIEYLRERTPSGLDQPLLLIDDEADQASIDTNDQEQLDDGSFDEDYDPTRINGQIRRLLRSFSRSAYVAYTATPFANILIHDERVAREYGSDLFPSGFVISLPTPSTYIGPAALFGLDADARPAQDPLPMLRQVEQAQDAWITPRHKKDYRPLFQGEDRIPPSLEVALGTFILARAARVARGQGTEHASMLVHVSRFTAVHGHVHRQVQDWMDRAKRTIEYAFDGSALDAEFARLWRHDFEPVTTAVLSTRFGEGLAPLRWEEVRPHVPAAIERIKPVMVNQDSRTGLDYEKYKDRGLHVIAIGGDKLSRGLTLEGLLVSYFLRTSTQYDTLMQMGRWFGYRPGYADLCRIFMTDELQDWFRHIATASEELRVQFNHMANSGATPKDFGLRVASHDVLAVTAPNKMRHGEEAEVSFAGTVKIQTVFERATETIEANYRAFDGFFRTIGREPEMQPARPDGSKALGSLWRNVPGHEVATLLSTLSYAEATYDVNSRLADYIRECNRAGELVTWTVYLASGEGGGVARLGTTVLQTIKREPKTRDRDGFVSFRTVLSPADEAIDLTPEEYATALARTIERVRREDPSRKQPDRPGGPEIRAIRGTDARRGLLLVYPMSAEFAGLPTKTPLIGVVLSFPSSATPRTVSYVFNAVSRRLELRS